MFLSQPNWRDKTDFMRFGKPRLGFLISSGNIDSMVNHYTVAKNEGRQITIPLVVSWEKDRIVP